MAFTLASQSRRRFSRPSWSGAAFIVEALFLLLFLAAATAIFVQLFAHAATQASESVSLSRAVALASNISEQFAADPTKAEPVYEVDGLIAYCDITQEERDGGILYKATISVRWREGGRTDDAIEAARATNAVGTANATSASGATETIDEDEANATDSAPGTTALTSENTAAAADDGIYVITTARYVGGENS